MKLVNANISRVKENKIKIFTWNDIKNLIEWIFHEKKKPSYISVKKKPIMINLWFIEKSVDMEFTGILLEYFSLEELKNVIKNFYANKSEKKSEQLINAPLNTYPIKYKDILRFTKNNYKTIYEEKGKQINLDREIDDFKLKNFWVAKDPTEETKKSILILDCEMIEIIDSDKKTDEKIKTTSKECFNLLSNKKTFAEIQTNSQSQKINISSNLQISNVYHKEEGHKKHVARVTIINIEGCILLDKYILPKYPIINFHTAESGVTKESLNKAIPLIKLYEKIGEIIYSDTVLVGHAIANDLLSLSINHHLLIDTSRLFSNRGFKNSLKKLCKKYFDKNIQTGSHSSLEDCLVTRDLFLLKANQYLNLLTSKRYTDIVINQNNEIQTQGINIMNINTLGDIKIHDLSINILFYAENDKLFFKLF